MTSIHISDTIHIFDPINFWLCDILHSKNSNYTIYNADYRRDAFLCMKIWKEIIKKEKDRKRKRNKKELKDLLKDISMRNFDFESHWNTFIFLDKKWCQIWLCPVKQCLFWFKLRCLSRTLTISWDLKF